VPVPAGSGFALGPSMTGFHLKCGGLAQLAVPDLQIKELHPHGGGGGYGGLGGRAVGKRENS